MDVGFQGIQNGRCVNNADHSPITSPTPIVHATATIIDSCWKICNTNRAECETFYFGWVGSAAATQCITYDTRSTNVRGLVNGYFPTQCYVKLPNVYKEETGTCQNSFTKIDVPAERLVIKEAATTRPLCKAECDSYTAADSSRCYGYQFVPNPVAEVAEEAADGAE